MPSNRVVKITLTEEQYAELCRFLKDNLGSWADDADNEELFNDTYERILSAGQP